MLPSAVLPLVRLAAFRSVDMRPARGIYWFPTPALPRRFRRSWRFLPFAVPRSLAQTGSSSRKLHSPSEYFPLRARPTPPGVERLPWGWLFPLRDLSLRRPLRNGASTPRRLSVLGVSHAFDGFLRHRPCGFISPHSHVQGFPSGVDSSHTAVPSSSLRSCPLVG